MNVHLLAHIGHGTFVNSLANQTLAASTTAAGMGVAFVFGMGHALTPGHGKTVASAYLVGNKGSVRHALILSVTTTIAHTISVFSLGLIALFASQYVLPEQLYPVLSLVSGLSVCAVGFWLLDRQMTNQKIDSHTHEHSHVRIGTEGVSQKADSPESIQPLLALGISGGLVPCPSALVLLLSAVALHQTLYGIALVSAFSLGLAAVLTTIGLLALYARRWLEWLPDQITLQQNLAKASAVLVVFIGAVLTACSVV